MWVSPFRDLRINGYLLLPEAYRSLSRPSSALSAKASALRPSCLTLYFGHPSTIALASGLLFFHELHRLYPLRYSLISGLFDNVTFVTPRMSSYLLRFKRLDIDLCVCSFQGASDAILHPLNERLDKISSHSWA